MCRQHLPGTVRRPPPRRNPAGPRVL